MVMYEFLFGQRIVKGWHNSVPLCVAQHHLGEMRRILKITSKR